MKHWKGIALILGVYDAISVTVAYFIALWLRFDCRYSLIPEDYYLNWLGFTPIYSILNRLLYGAKALPQYVAVCKLQRAFAHSVCVLYNGCFPYSWYHGLIRQDAYFIQFYRSGDTVRACAVNSFCIQVYASCAQRAQLRRGDQECYDNRRRFCRADDTA